MSVDWQSLFAFETPLLEIFIRGTVVYLALVLLMRFGMSRGMGSLGVSDMLVIVIIADASQNAMAGEYRTITDGLLLVVTIVFWDYFIDALTYRFPALEKVFLRHKICLVRKGRILHKNMRREFITKDELMAQLRVNGVDDVKKVREACLEANGEVSVIKYKD